MMDKYDLIVIGAGPGGYVSAIRGAQLGMKIALIDERLTLGGTCLNEGCIPSKALLYTSEMFKKFERQGPLLGILSQGLEVDFDRMMEHKTRAVKSLTDGLSGLIKKNQIEFIRGRASFSSPQSVLVQSEKGSLSIQGKYILIATGSEAISLPFLPFNGKEIISSKEALSLRSIPKDLIIIGGGVIGVEIGSIYSRLKTKVTVVEMLDRLCPNFDESLSDALLRLLKKQGIEFHLSSKVESASLEKGRVTLNLKGASNGELSSEAVLVAVGRRPFTQGLKLKEVGIKQDSQGFIEVDHSFRTHSESIFAIGDVIPGPGLAHRASLEGEAVVQMLSGNTTLIVNYLTVPNVIYTDPEVASVGLTEKEALDLGLKLKIGVAYFKANARARTSLEEEGFVKVIGEETSERLIGLHIIGSHASELIQGGMALIHQRSTLTEMGEMPFPHPTLSESMKEAFLAALGRAINF